MKSFHVCFETNFHNYQVSVDFFHGMEFDDSGFLGNMKNIFEKSLNLRTIKDLKFFNVL